MLRLQWRKLRSKHPWLQMLQSWRCAIFVVGLVFFIWYLLVALKERPTPNLAERVEEITVGNLEFDFRTGIFLFKDKNEVLIRGSMPDRLQHQMLPVHCGEYNMSRHMCVLWHGSVKLEVENKEAEKAYCQTVKWTPSVDAFTPQTCFSLMDASWYGGSLMSRQTWPLNKASLALQSYTTNNLDTYTGPSNIVGSVLDWFWISSNGVTVSLDHTFPFKVSVNQSGDHLLCIHSDSEQLNMPSPLKFTVCKSLSLRKAHRFITEKNMRKPVTLPGEKLFTKPLWSTHPYLTNNLDQDTMLKFAKDIHELQMEQNLFLIYDEESMFVRADVLDKERFLNAHQAMMYLREYGFNISLGISPFIPVSSVDNETYMVQDRSNKPIELIFRNQEFYVVDVQRPSVLNWYVDKLRRIMDDYRLHSFQLVGGEGSFYHKDDPSTFSADFDPNHFANRFTSVAEALKITPILSFSSSSQNVGGCIVLSSSHSSWDEAAGIQSIIPSVLTLGMMGYPFVIPNTVGGPGMKKISKSSEPSEKPDEELYHRWLQLSAYMPAMMFSFPPWLYGDEMVEQVNLYVKIHEETVAPLVLKAARAYELSGAPIIRPLWWNDRQTDQETLTIDDQYLIGDTLLVAPVLREKMTARDIYIPRGQWMDNLHKEEVTGRVWLRNYKVKVTEIPTFTRIHKTIE